MKKISVLRFGAATLIGFLTLNTQAQQGAPSVTPVAAVASEVPEGPTSKQVFHHYMGYNYVRQLFRLAQWEALGTPADTAFTHYFYNANAQFGNLFEELKAEHAQNLEEFSRYSHANSIRILPGYTRKYDQIHRTVVDVAISLGFSPESVSEKNLEIFIASGDMNAFTVSGDNSRIIVVVNTGLVERFDRVQLRAVLAHELGHIKAIHSVKSAMHDLMIGYIYSLYTGIQNPLEISNLMGLQGLSNCRSTGTCSMSHKNGFQQLGSPTKSKLDSPVFRALIKLMSSPPAAQQSLVQGYIVQLLKTMVSEGASPAAIAFFQDLLVRAPSPAFNLNSESFKKAIGEAMSAVSRSQEKTSDNFAMSVTPNAETAEAMAILAGQPLGAQFGLTREEKMRIRDMMRAQIEILKNRDPMMDLAPYDAGSHPAIVLRYNRIVDYPSYPAVVFANPFFRLLLLEDLLSSSSSEGDTGTSDNSGSEDQKAVLRALHEDIVGLITSTGLSRKVNPRFSNFIEYIAANRAAEIKALTEIDLLLQTKQLGKEDQITLANYLAELRSGIDRSYGLVSVLIASLENELKTSSNKEVVQARLEAARGLLSKDPQHLLELQKAAAKPVTLRMSKPAKNRIPEGTSTIANPFRQSACQSLLVGLNQVPDKEQPAQNTVTQ